MEKNIIKVQLANGDCVCVKNVSAERIETLKSWVDEGKEIIIEAYYPDFGYYLDINIKDIQKIL